MTINCLGNLIDLQMPRIMGVLNLTPDSFYDGGIFNREELVLKRVDKMLEEGATFIDLGAYSSRPGAADIAEEEEIKRLLPVMESILNAFPGIMLSIDTFRSTVASRCLEMGAAIINDISAGNKDPAMMKVVAGYQAPYIMMHMKGTPQNMQSQTAYNDLTTEVMYYFSEKIARARTLGINDCIIDPGFGFAKTQEQNYEILRDLDQMAVFGIPILAGLSRKSMIYKALGSSAQEALNGTTALHMVALQKGVHILRAHDVKEAMECIKLNKLLQKKY